MKLPSARTCSRNWIENEGSGVGEKARMLRRIVPQGTQAPPRMNTPALPGAGEEAQLPEPGAPRALLLYVRAMLQVVNQAHQFLHVHGLQQAFGHDRLLGFHLLHN